MKHLLWISFFLINLNTWCQKDSLLSALGIYEKLKQSSLPQSDTVVISALQETLNATIYTDPELAEYYAQIALKLAKKINNDELIAKGLLGVANTQINLQKIDSGRYYVDQAIEYCTKLNLDRWLMEAYSLRGNIGYYTSDYNMALENYFDALDMADKKYPKESAGFYANVGLVFWTIGNNEKSKEYLLQANKLGTIYKDTVARVYALNNLGIVCKNMGDYEEALEYYEIGLELSLLSNNLRREGEFVYNMANLLFIMGKDEDRAFQYLDRSAEITEMIGTDRDKAIEYSNLGDHYYEFMEYRKSLKYSTMGLEYAKKTGYWEVEIEALKNLSRVNYVLGNYQKAYEQMIASNNLKDSMDLSNINTEAIAVEQAYEEEKAAFEDSLLREKEYLEKVHQDKLQHEKVKSRETLLLVAIGVIFLVIIGLIFLVRSNKKVKQKNAIITERNEVITYQKEEIEEQHQEIKDSINYAQRIQNALISGNEEWDKISLDHFVLFQPKDVVSGDFYWAHHSESDNISIWVTADCTGHGVPGAFMSMLGIGFLNEIVIENGERDGATILNKLREKIIHALRQKNSEIQQKDGMDMALCIWNKNNHELSFTGANNSLYLIRKTELVDPSKFDKCLAHQNGFTLAEIRANKMPVGFQSDKMESFVSKTLKLEKGDMIITFTDGFADQFGGEKGRKLKYKPFKEILLANNQKPIKLQGEILDQEFNNWKGALEQIDDVCIIGVRV